MVTAIGTNRSDSGDPNHSFDESKHTMPSAVNTAANLSCYEIVRFRFVTAVPLARQAELLAILGQWARQQPGFCSRQTLHEESSGWWTDIVEWADFASAMAATAAVQQAEALGPVMSLIEGDSVQMGHYQRRPDAEGR